ncbi:trace amine-associated receptor 1-like [Takifugu rubripes]|uniref:trace amine-associated receptor 1-like n=1 Tax=Takifugu rubripes TaxID=31033 RepID=UPI00114566C4|nr:trace amine-associated receptor 1-like [Takifugu rubripes]
MDLHLFHNRSDVFEDHCNESSSRFGITNIVSPYLLCAIFGLLSVITVCGNLLVITAILYFRQLHSPTHYLILSLAVADLLVGVLVLPFSAVLIVEPCFYLQTFISVIILTTYLKILIVAQRQARAIKKAAFLSRLPGEMLNKTQRKATRILAIVMGIFFLCWTPFILCLTFNPLNYNTLTVSVIEFFKWLAWSNSMLNPFVYAFFYSWFRSAFKMIISGQIFQGDFMNSKLF